MENKTLFLIISKNIPKDYIDDIKNNLLNDNSFDKIYNIMSNRDDSNIEIDINTNNIGFIETFSDRLKNNLSQKIPLVLYKNNSLKINDVLSSNHTNKEIINFTIERTADSSFNILSYKFNFYYNENINILNITYNNNISHIVQNTK